MTVTNLFLYPVKSLGGIAVQEAKMTTRGFQYDRRWMIIDEQGVFISQRSHPLMASIKVSITEEGLQLYTHNDPKGVIVPMAPYEELPVTQVKVWESACSAVGGFMAANIWLSSQLSIECQIVYMPEETNRLINSELVSPNSIVSFADGYPYLVIGSASLTDLNERLEQAVNYERFRPNIVVKTEIAFEEDHWKEFQLGEALFSGVKPCSRCRMINLDPEKLSFSKEPLQTLAKYRKEGKKVKFGLNALWKNEGQMVRVGDEVVSR